MHAKAVIVRTVAADGSSESTVTLVGSANLTEGGMAGNSELIVEIPVNGQSQCAKWFDNLWGGGEEIHDPADLIQPDTATAVAPLTDIPAGSTSPVPIPYESSPPGVGMNRLDRRRELIGGLLYELGEDESDRVESRVTLLIGASGAFKTFALLGLGMKLAVGDDSLAIRRCKVFYLAGEAPSDVERRANVMLRKHDKDAQNVICKNMRIGSRSVPFDDKDPCWTGLRRHLSEEFKPDVVISDTLQHMMPFDADENSARDMHRMMEVVRKTAQCHWIITHHTGKNPESVERGSSALRANADTVWRVDADSRNIETANTKKVLMQVIKSRDRPSGDCWELSFEDDADSLVLTDISPIPQNESADSYQL